MNQLKSIGISVGMLLLSLSVHATPQLLLSDLQDMRLASTGALTNFYMFTGLDADKKYEQRIENSVQSFVAALESATTLAGANDMEEDIQAITASWQQFTELLDENRLDMTSRGYPDVRMVDDMGRQNTDIVSLISSAYESLQQKSGIRPNEVVSKARDLALLMEEITSQYSARGTSNLGQVFVGSHDRSLVDMAEDFRQNLTELEAMLDNNNGPILKSIQSKWRFMERSVKNYNDNTVPFLVVSYNDRIIQHLSELEAQYQ